MMKPVKAALLLSIVFLSTLAIQAAAEPGARLDVVSYRIEAVIESERIKETVTLTAVAPRPVKKLEMTFASSMDLHSCRYNGTDVPFERSGWDLTLDLGKAGSPKGEFSLVFEAGGRPYNNQRNKYIRTVISPEHAYIRSQYSWYPRLAGEPAVYDTTLTVREGWQVRTAGDLVEKKETEAGVAWRFVLKKPCRCIGLAAGDYITVEEQGAGGIALDTLVFSGHEEGGKALLQYAAQAIKFYTDRFGPMSEKRFTLVEMPSAFGSGSGYGETGYALIGTGAYQGGGSAAWAESLVAHEVAHTWWGREIGFTNFASEMLATYTTYRYLERYNGKEAAQEERGRSVNNLVNVLGSKGGVALDAISGFGNGLDPVVYTVHAYDKAAMMLHMLEGDMGREAFDASLKKFFQTHRDQVLDYQQVAKKLGGSKYRYLFQQWGESDIPALRVEHEAKKSGKGYGIKGTLYQEGTRKPFRMNVPLRAVAGKQVHDHTVAVKKAKTSFKFSCPFEPEKISIDPESNLVFTRGALEVDVEALSKAVFQVVNSPGVSDRKILEKTIRDIDKLLEAGGGKKSEVIAGKGRLLFRLGELDEACELLEKAINLRDSGPFWQSWIYLRLGCIADLQKKRKDAEKFYEKASRVTNGSQTAIQKANRFLKKAYKGYKRDG